MALMPIERIRGASLHEALRLLPYTTGLTALLCAGIAVAKRWRQPTFEHSGVVIELAIAASVLALVLRWLFNRPASSATSATAHAAASWVLAVQLGVIPT